MRFFGRAEGKSKDSNGLQSREEERVSSARNEKNRERERER